MALSLSGNGLALIRLNTKYTGVASSFFAQDKWGFSAIIQRPNGVAGDECIIAIQSEGSQHRTHWLGMNSAGAIFLEITNQGNDDSDRMTFSSDLDDGNMHYVAGRSNGDGTYQIFVDGTWSSTSMLSVTGTYPPALVRCAMVGALANGVSDSGDGDPVSPSNHFTGQIAEACWWVDPSGTDATANLGQDVISNADATALWSSGSPIRYTPFTLHPRVYVPFHRTPFSPIPGFNSKTWTVTSPTLHGDAEIVDDELLTTSIFDDGPNCIRLMLIADPQLGRNFNSILSLAQEKAGLEKQIAVANRFSFHEVIDVGDHVENHWVSGNSTQTDAYLDATSNLADRYTMRRTPGNHDYNTATGRTNWGNNFGDHSYIVDLPNDNRLIIWDCMRVWYRAQGLTANFSLSDYQADLNWLLDALDDLVTDGKTGYVVTHVPLFRDDEASTDDFAIIGDGNTGDTGGVQTRSTIMAKMREVGCHYWLCGHLHGNHHITSGGVGEEITILSTTPTSLGSAGMGAGAGAPAYMVFYIPDEGDPFYGMFSVDEDPIGVPEMPTLEIQYQPTNQTQISGINSTTLGDNSTDTHTVESDTDGITFKITHRDTTTPSRHVTGIVWGGQSAVKIGNAKLGASTTAVNCEIWFIDRAKIVSATDNYANPEQPFQITFNDSTTTHGQAATVDNWKNVNQATPFRTPDTFAADGATSGTDSVEPESQPGDKVIGLCGLRHEASTANGDINDQTENFNWVTAVSGPNGVRTCGIMKDAGAGATTELQAAWTTTSTALTRAFIGVAMVPAEEPEPATSPATLTWTTAESGGGTGEAWSNPANALTDDTSVASVAVGPNFGFADHTEPLRLSVLDSAMTFDITLGTFTFTNPVRALKTNVSGTPDISMTRAVLLDLTDSENPVDVTASFHSGDPLTTSARSDDIVATEADLTGGYSVADVQALLEANTLGAEFQWTNSEAGTAGTVRVEYAGQATLAFEAAGTGGISSATYRLLLLD